MFRQQVPMGVGDDVVEGGEEEPAHEETQSK
jgi:hypothetical protein